jgi:hypothetical protein
MAFAALAGAAPWHLGGAGDDTVRLGSRPDRFDGRGGDDRLWGGGGNDALRGGGGDDRLVGGRGSDALYGGPGADRLDARDGRGDEHVWAGSGRDVCLADAADLPALRGCELVRGPAGRVPPGDGSGGTPPPAGSPPVYSDAFVNRNWAPTPFDSCPRALHESYSVLGPDGKLYPAWHPPSVIDPATGEPCSFGHEHGRDPRGSDIYGWVAEHLAAPGHRAEAGIPFGYASEALFDYATANPGLATRPEDHVGHKVDYANDVALLDDEGHYVTATVDGEQRKVVCDYLFKVHQGSHSADATANNAHELLYASRCTDGTELISDTLARFGEPNQFNRSCAPGAVVATSGSSLPGGSGGRRLIPDRGCVEQYVLVETGNPAAASDPWSLYENWEAESELRTAGGQVLAHFDPWFAVRNPSRYFWAGAGTGGANGVGRTLAAAWEADGGDGGLANRPPWSPLAALEPFEFRDPRSPFDGAERDFYLDETALRNQGGPQRWYTDPYGENASATPFPGAICQLLSATDNSSYPPLQRRLFGRERDYGSAGVHAPN